MTLDFFRISFKISLYMTTPDINQLVEKFSQLLKSTKSRILVLDEVSSAEDKDELILDSKQITEYTNKDLEERHKVLMHTYMGLVIENFALDAELISAYHKYAQTKPGMNRVTKEQWREKFSQVQEQIDEHFLQICSMIATLDAKSVIDMPIAALIVDPEFNIIALQTNAVETYKQPAAHAEMLAIHQACSLLQNNKLKDCTLYVNLEPCTMCLATSIEAQFARLVYACPSDKKGAVGGKYDLQQVNNFN